MLREVSANLTQVFVVSIRVATNAIASLFNLFDRRNASMIATSLNCRIDLLLKGNVSSISLRFEMPEQAFQSTRKVIPKLIKQSHKFRKIACTRCGLP